MQLVNVDGVNHGCCCSFAAVNGGVCLCIPFATRTKVGLVVPLTRAGWLMSVLQCEVMLSIGQHAGLLWLQGCLQSEDVLLWLESTLCLPERMHTLGERQPVWLDDSMVNSACQCPGLHMLLSSVIESAPAFNRCVEILQRGILLIWCRVVKVNRW